jgi:hypothetical protein
MFAASKPSAEEGDGYIEQIVVHTEADVPIL